MKRKWKEGILNSKEFIENRWIDSMNRFLEKYGGLNEHAIRRYKEGLEKLKKKLDEAEERYYYSMMKVYGMI